MREIRTSGSEGGGTEPNRPSLPLSKRCAQCARGLPYILVTVATTSASNPMPSRISCSLSEA